MILKSQWQTHVWIHPPLPGLRKAGWLASKHLRLFRSWTLLPAYPRTRPHRRCEMSHKWEERAWRKGAWHGPSTRFETIPQRCNPCRHLTRRGGHPFLKHFKLFFPPSPPGLQRGYNSNDPRLSISRKGFSKWGGGCRYAIFYFLFFLFLSSFLPFHSREREMVNWISRLTLGFPFLSIRATSVT